MHGDEDLQHQESEPKHVWPPPSRIVFWTASCLSARYRPRLMPIFSSVGRRGQDLTGMQQKASARTSPPRQSCLGELYQPCSSAYLVMAPSSPASVRSLAPRARETMSA